MSKGTNLISEIGKYFKENDATSAIYYCLNHSDFIGAYTPCDMRLKPNGGDPRLRSRKRGERLIVLGWPEAPPEVPTYGGQHQPGASPQIREKSLTLSYERI